MGRLTVNLGVRYDFGSLVYAENVCRGALAAAGRQPGREQLSPRLGFAFSVNDRTVVRGGYGKYFAEVSDQPALLHADAERRGHHPGGKRWTARLHDATRSTARSRPWSRYFARTCRTADVPGASARRIDSAMASPDSEIPYSHQVSHWCQRQLGDDGGGPGGLHLQRHTPRLPQPERQPDLQPRHGRELSDYGPQQALQSCLRGRPDGTDGGQGQLPRAADGFYQAVEQPLAGLGQLHAVGVARRFAAPAQRNRRSSHSRWLPTWEESTDTP